MQHAVAVIDDPAAAAAALDPVRSRVLAVLAAAEASAAGVAGHLGLPRQKVGYHLHALEDQGLVAEVGRRSHGGLTERVFRATAATYVVSPAAMGATAPDPERIEDRLSAAYLVAVAARAVTEVGRLVAGAARAGMRLPTLAIDADIRFRSAADRAAFADELGVAVRALASEYHDPSAKGGRWYRIAVLAHPRPTGTTNEETP